MTYLYQRLKAPNDVNGNPRRLYAVYSTYEDNGHTYAEVAKVIDEGHVGRQALPEDVRRIGTELAEVNISAGEYNAWMRAGRDLTGTRR